MSSSNCEGSSSTPTANAWSRPFQERRRASRSDPIAPPPGMGVPSKEGEPARTKDQKLENPAVSNSNGVSLPSVLRERFIQLSLSMVGQRVVITQTDGGVIEGILHTFTPFASQPPHMRNKYVVKSCKRVVKSSTGGSDEVRRESVSDGSTVIIPTELVSSVHVKSMRLDTGINNGNSKTSLAQNEEKRPWSFGNREMLRTDAEISVGKGGRDRDLVAAGSAWTSDASSPANSRADTMIGLQDEKGAVGGRKGFGTPVGVGGGLRGSIGEWDQFKANEDLFDVRASFDENLYTTELDKSQINRMEMRKAEQLAREIENTASSNIHVAEERGHVVESDFDEEDKYSGVLARGATINSQTVANEIHEDFSIEVDDGESKQMTTARELNVSPTSVPEPSQPITPARMKMNYAAAAAKADATSSAKTLPPGFGDTRPAVANSVGSVLGSPPPAGKRSTRQEDSSVASTESKVEGVDSTLVHQDDYHKKAAKSPTSDGKRANGGANMESQESVEAVAKDQEDPISENEANLNGRKIDHSIEPSLTPSEKQAIDDNSSSDLYPKKVTSKLNANAKAFTFNPDAKSFTPSTGVGADVGDPPSLAADPHLVIPNTALSTVGATSAQQIQTQQPHYVQYPSQMGQPGIMPMMNVHLNTTMRYQGASHPYPGIDQHAPPLQPHQQSQHGQQMHSPQGQEGGTATAAPGSGEDLSTQQGQQQQSRTQQQQGVPIPYNLPPAGAAAYYNGGMSLHPHSRVPGAPHLGGGFHHQLAGGPQQMPVVPGTNPYRHIYGTPTHLQQASGIPSGTQMHVPGGGSPYYPNPGSTLVTSGIHYPPGAYIGHGPVEDGAEPEYRGGGGRGNARGGGGRGGKRNSRKNGRGSGGRGGYHTNQSMQHHGGGSESQTPQNNGNVVNSAPSPIETSDQPQGPNSGEAKDSGKDAPGESN